MNLSVEKSSGSENVKPSASNQHKSTSVQFTERPQHRLLRLPEVSRLTGYKRSSLYGKTDPNSRQFDPTFPSRVHLSLTGRGAVGWFESEIFAWLESRGHARSEPRAKSRSSH